MMWVRDKEMVLKIEASEWFFDVCQNRMVDWMKYPKI
jgi:hypothetical protein